LTEKAKIVHELTMEYLRRTTSLKRDVSIKEFVKFYLQTQVEIDDELSEYISQPEPRPLT